MSKCRSCGAEIIWAKTGSGKLMPLDLDKDRGTIRIDNGFAVMLTLDAIVAAVEAGETLYTSHFATCPNASSHRKAK